MNCKVKKNTAYKKNKSQPKKLPCDECEEEFPIEKLKKFSIIYDNLNDEVYLLCEKCHKK